MKDDSGPPVRAMIEATIRKYGRARVSLYVHLSMEHGLVDEEAGTPGYYPTQVQLDEWHEIAHGGMLEG